MQTDTELIRTNLKYLALLARDYPSQAAAASAVSYTHLDVYKRQAFYP